MTKSNAASKGRNLIALIMAAVLIVATAASFLYRMDHPEMQREVEHQHKEQGAVAGNQQPDMAQVQQLMAKMQENPDDPHVLIDLAESFMRMQAWDRALVFLDRAAALTPEEPTPLRGKGVVLFQQGKHQEAVDVFEKVVVMAPDDASSYFNLGILYKYYLEQPQKGVENFRKASEHVAPGDPLKEKIAHELEGHEE